MTAGNLMNHCPSEETLAAFIDGRLDGEARRHVVEHLAECAECRDTVLMADELAAADVVPRADNVVRGRFPSRVIPALLAVAAAIVLVFLIPGIRDRVLGGGTGMGALADAAESIKHRPTYARLNTDFEYKPARKSFRGAEDGEPNDLSTWAVQEVMVRLESRRAKSELSARDLHVLGVSHLLVGSDDKAVKFLEDAVKRATGAQDARKAVAASDDVALLTDLTNAYVARGTVADLIAAAEVAQRAWSLEPSPATAWNRALTLEARDPRAALAAWDDYLRLDLDSSSPWAIEVPGRKEDLLARSPVSPE